MKQQSLCYYMCLVGINLVYACTSIFSKTASQYDFMSLPYILYVAGAIAVMGVYALLWQQIIKRAPISDAYMFKGTSVIFVMALSAVLFGEHISINNIVGSLIIVLGIALFARS